MLAPCKGPRLLGRNGCNISESMKMPKKNCMKDDNSDGDEEEEEEGNNDDKND